MRYVFRLGLALALSLALMAGCSDENGQGGSGGTAGVGGMAGTAGTAGAGGMAECQSALQCGDGEECTIDRCTNEKCKHTFVFDGTACDESNECSVGVCSSGACNSEPVADGTACDEANECAAGVCSGGACDTEPVADGTVCGDGAGTCQQRSCQVACTEQGIRDAIAAGGGPYTFDCDGPTTVVTESEILVDNDAKLDGEGKLTVDGSGGSGHFVFSIVQGVTAELSGFTINNSSRSYAGISNRGTLTVMLSTVSNNDEIGISHIGSGGLTVARSKISGNRGVGIMQNGGALTLMESAVWRNGVGIISHEGQAKILNSTISENTGSWSACSTSICVSVEGGVFSLSATIEGSTLSGNSDPTFVGDSVRNTLIVGSCKAPGGVHVTSLGHNIESPGDTCGLDQATDQVNVSADDLKLGELADNGGPTMTHALGAGSAAIDQVPAADCVDADGEPLTTDQRGEPRPVAILEAEPKCDVGAFEVQP